MTQTAEAPAEAPAKSRATKVNKMEETLREMVGKAVRLTVVFNIRGSKTTPQTVQGLLLAVGKKMGPWDGYTTPTCAVVRTANGEVLIVSARSVSEAAQDGATPA